MPDLCLDVSHPFALVTTVRRAGPRARTVHTQLELDLPGYSLRLRFADAHSLGVFSEAVAVLFSDAVDHCVQGDGDVRVRIVQPNAVQLVLPY